jgi:neutral ceramidase
MTMKAAPLVLSLSLLSCVESEVGPAPTDTAAGFSPAHCQYEAPPPRPAATPGPAPVRAGVGEAALDMPVGTPLGGYTARVSLLGGAAPDGRKSPFAKAFYPSVGVQSRPLARALYLEAGGDPILLIKVDLCVAYDRLVQDLERALSPDGKLRGRIVVAASHTHAGWGTYQGVYHLALGFDVFMEPQYQRLLGSLTQAGKAAIAAAQPARLGAGVWDGWDPADEIFSDRRADIHKKLKGKDGKPIGPHKDNRLLVLRVDDALGQPLAVLFHFPMHGTVSGEENPLASVESTGHVELALEERFDRQVLVMHLQGPGGDASPRGRGGLSSCDAKKGMLCANFARMESIGEIAAPRIYDLWAAMETAREAELEVATRAVPNGRGVAVRDGLRYTPYDETAIVDASPEAIYTPDGQVRGPITQFNVEHGAALCGNTGSPLPVRGIEGAAGVPYESCRDLGAAAQFVATALRSEAPKLPECETTRTTVSAVRLAGVPVTRRLLPEGGGPPIWQGRREDLLLVTLPGEPVSLLADALRAGSPAGPDRTFVVGYAQGHVGYLLQVEDWLAGGYEPSINIYGPLEGEWLMERALDVAKVAWTQEREDPEARQQGRYDRLSFAPGSMDPMPRAKAPGAGQVPASVPADLLTRSREVPKEAQPPLTVPRVVGRATLVFQGGDPGEDLPEVILEREAQGAWEPVLRRSGRKVGTRGKDMVLIYTPQPVGAAPGQAERHLWSVEWQAVGWERGPDTQGLAGVLSAPTGRYRLVATGRAEGKAYRVESRPFSLTGEGVVAVTASRSGDRVSGRATYPVGAGYRLLRLDGASDGNVPLWGMAAVRVQSKADGASQEVTVPLTDGKFEVRAVGLNMSQGATVTVRDSAGNSGQGAAP